MRRTGDCKYGRNTMVSQGHARQVESVGKCASRTLGITRPVLRSFELSCLLELIRATYNDACQEQAQSFKPAGRFGKGVSQNVNRELNGPGLLELYGGRPATYEMLMSELPLRYQKTQGADSSGSFQLLSVSGASKQVPDS